MLVEFDDALAGLGDALVGALQLAGPVFDALFQLVVESLQAIARLLQRGSPLFDTLFQFGIEAHDLLLRHGHRFVRLGDGRQIPVPAANVAADDGD